MNMIQFRSQHGDGACLRYGSSYSVFGLETRHYCPWGVQTFYQFLVFLDVSFSTYRSIPLRRITWPCDLDLWPWRSLRLSVNIRFCLVTIVTFLRQNWAQFCYQLRRVGPKLGFFVSVLCLYFWFVCKILFFILLYFVFYFIHVPYYLVTVRFYIIKNCY